MSYRIVLIVVLSFAPRFMFACVLGSLATQGREMKACYDVTGLGNSYDPAINNTLFKDFLVANADNAEVAQATQKLFDFSPAQMIEYLEKEVAADRHSTRMFADTDADVPTLRRIAKLYNDYYSYTPLIEEQVKKQNAEKEELSKAVVISEFNELETIANANGRIIPGLKAYCAESRNAEVSNVHALRIAFSDNKTNEIIPLGVRKTDGQQKRGELFYMDGNEMATRTVYMQEGKLFWIDKKGKEWAVGMEKVSFKNLTRVRPLNFNGSDACMLSHQFERANSSGAGAAAGAASPVKTEP